MQGLVVATFDKQVAAAAPGRRARRLAEGRHLAAARAAWSGFFTADGLEQSVRPFKEWPEDLGASPRDFMVDSDKREQDLLQLSIAQLSDIIERQDATGADDRKERVCLQLRISYPFSCLILALLGVSLPYLFPQGRRALTGAALNLLGQPGLRHALLGQHPGRHQPGQERNSAGGIGSLVGEHRLYAGWSGCAVESEPLALYFLYSTTTFQQNGFKNGRTPSRILSVPNKNRKTPA